MSCDYDCRVLAWEVKNMIWYLEEKIIKIAAENFSFFSFDFS